eukprot:TRINITY_DN93_c0_g2_i1.p1 TRINITY_DN93_c0_g2~~TRINITY_DN93_c0_g2_i1.p1  ORF type:complete len:506 (-),score=167.86 TRINITY_DN93_c0_g2_i1:425-1804(-)
MGEEPLIGEGRRDVGLKLETVMLCQVPNLALRMPTAGVANHEIVKNSSGGSTFYNKLLGDEDCIIYEHVRDKTKAPVARAFLRAGPRAKLHFDPTTVNACIVTCGLLCPGLNSVIHHLIDTLKNNYNAGKIYGIRGGWGGFWDPEKPPIQLCQSKDLEFLQSRAGSILGCSVGGFDVKKIMQFLMDKQISHMYVIGGDGTHRGAHRIAVECIAMGLNIAVAGIPKSVDNDIDLVDRSFGFMTAVEEAQNAIRSATIEAKCNLPNGIGIVKLMGRSTGYLAAYATMASGDVDLCLVPEVEIRLDGPDGCLPHLERVVQTKGYAVVVISEGAGQAQLSEVAAEARSKGAPLPSVGQYMKSQIEKHFASKGKTATCKYIDPSVSVRSVAANAFDQILCMQLAQNAVHGAMAGYTAFAAGVVNNRTVLIPITEIVDTSPKGLNPRGRTWERVLCITRQPNTLS